MTIIQRLLFASKSKFNTIGAAIGALIGIVLLLSAVQIYVDVRSLMNNSSNYVTINKKVTLLDTGLSFLAGAQAIGGFTPAELDDIRNQPFCRSLSAFSSNQFQVSASNRSVNFFTMLFCQSIPHEFLDNDNAAFRWVEGQETLPVIISYDYLALYNFAFAPSQNLPPFTESTIGNFPLDITVWGNNKLKTYKGKIVGFSRRINSILVPESFMAYANEQFGERKVPTKQVMIQLDNPYDKTFTEYIKSKGYEPSTGGLIGDELKGLLQVLMTSIFVIGGLITLLSLLVFVLNFRLIVSESSADLRLLMQLGYKQMVLRDLLNKRFYRILAIVLLGSSIFVGAFKFVLNRWFAAQGFELNPSPAWQVLVLAVLVAVLFVSINRWSVRRSIAALA